MTTLQTRRELKAPTLQVAGQWGEEMSATGVEDNIVRALRISAEARQRIPSSDGERAVVDGARWTLPQPSKADPIELLRRCRSPVGGRIRSPEIDIGVLNRDPESRTWRRRVKPAAVPQHQTRESVEEMIAASHKMLNLELAREIVLRVHSFSPAFFERLIVDLLVRMGYGGGRMEMGRAIGRVGDGGVDGVIKEDELGLDVVYVQAKRLDPDNGVPVREVRDFVGGLEGHRATKGVFVTTSYFPSTAYEFITRVTKRVVLIDGSELASLMIRHRVGVRVKDVYEVKKIDDDYFVD